MRARALAAPFVVGMSLLVLWTVDPARRTPGALAVGLLSALAGTALVGLLLLAARRRRHRSRDGTAQ